MHLLTKIYSCLCGEKVGTDNYGNTYYQSKCTPKSEKRKKRWVIYNGIAEASKVPPNWHIWLHYSSDTPITNKDHTWQKDYLPNLTGTNLAYMPPGHDKSGGVRSEASADYEAWEPKG